MNFEIGQHILQNYRQEQTGIFFTVHASLQLGHRVVSVDTSNVNQMCALRNCCPSVHRYCYLVKHQQTSMTACHMSLHEQCFINCCTQ